MNYGYAPTTRDAELAAALEELCLRVPTDSHGLRPYVERDGPYPGVRIRRITHYTDAVRDDILRQADEIFDSIV